jgi:hypothetical protein
VARSGPVKASPLQVRRANGVGGADLVRVELEKRLRSGRKTDPLLNRSRSLRDRRSPSFFQYKPRLSVLIDQVISVF